MDAALQHRLVFCLASSSADAGANGVDGANQILTSGQLSLAYDDRRSLITSGGATYASNADNLLTCYLPSAAASASGCAPNATIPADDGPIALVCGEVFTPLAPARKDPVVQP